MRSSQRSLSSSIAGGALPADALGGSASFSVFVADGSTTSLNSASVIYFGYDDIPDNAPGNPLSDDNHDDIIIRATIMLGSLSRRPGP